jgi:hypothetical protein
MIIIIIIRGDLFRLSFKLCNSEPEIPDGFWNQMRLKGKIKIIGTTSGYFSFQLSIRVDPLAPEFSIQF